ncbi:hypothetical protein ACIQXV_16460 [Neobacillus sp. NPDC097160]
MKKTIILLLVLLLSTQHLAFAVGNNDNVTSGIEQGDGSAGLF